MPRVECPKCEQFSEVEAEAFGHLTECPYCQAVFPAIDEAPDPLEPTSEPTFFQRYYSENYDPEDPDERERVIAEARRRVAVPAYGLIASSVLGIAVTVVIGLIVIINELDDFRRGWGRGNNIFMAVGTTIAVSFYFLVIAAGGLSLKRLQHRGLCSTAATLGIVGMAFCGIYMVFSAFGFLFGTWAFISLGNREVRHAMRWKRREREERRSGW